MSSLKQRTVSDQIMRTRGDNAHHALYVKGFWFKFRKLREPLLKFYFNLFASIMIPFTNGYDVINKTNQNL